MNILFFTRRFWPEIGGVEKHIFEVAKRLVSMGHSVTVISENKGFANKENIDGVIVYRIPVGEDDWFKKFRIWSWLFAHKNLIVNADIVHAHDVYFWYFPFRFLYPFKPSFITFHGYETKFPPSKKAILVRKVSEMLAKGNICVGKYIEKWYKTRATAITYGATSQIKNSKLKIQNYNSKLKIVFVGRLEKDNGGEIYVDALELLKKQNINFEFIAVGDGSMREDFEKYGKVTGFIENADRYIQSSDVVFASSYLSILEAFALKKFVISVYASPLKKDYLTMTPFAQDILITNTPQEIVKAIDNLKKDNKNIQNKIDAAYSWVKFQTWDELVKTYIRLWNGGSL